MRMTIERGFWVNLVWLNPWLVVLPAYLSGIRYRVNATTVTLFNMTAIVFLLNATIKGNFALFANGLLLGLLWLVPRSASIPKSGLYLGCLYIGAGLLSITVVANGYNGRIGLYGGEANFSGFVTVMFLCIALHQRSFRTVAVIFVLILAYYTASRALVLMTAVSFFLYAFRRRRFLVLLFTCSAIATTFNAGQIIDLLIDSGLATPSGYVEGVERLLILADSSTNERIFLSETWTRIWTADIYSILFGASAASIDQGYQVAGKVAHNSYVQKGTEFGLLFIMVFFVHAFRLVPIWIVCTMAIFGLFLHNLFSVPWVLALYIFLNGSISTTRQTDKLDTRVS